jgi:cytochrome c
MDEAEMKRLAAVALATILLSPAFAEGDPTRGQQDFRACAPCHSLQPDRNMTGPSLAGIWGRKAASLPSFERYSDALKSSGIVWLVDPEAMVPGNDMPFAGIKDFRARADLLAFLRQATKPGAQQQMAQQGGMKGMGGGGMMGGMMGGGHDPDLKSVDRPSRSRRSPTVTTPTASPLRMERRALSGNAICA